MNELSELNNSNESQNFVYEMSCIMQELFENKTH